MAFGQIIVVFPENDEAALSAYPDIAVDYFQKN